MRDRPSDPPSPTELTQSGELTLPRVKLTPDAGEFLAGRITHQHHDELDTRKLRAIKI